MQSDKVGWDPPSHFSTLLSSSRHLSLCLCLVLCALSLDKCDIINPLVYMSSQGRFPEDHRHIHCPDPKNLYVWGLDNLVPKQQGKLLLPSLHSTPWRLIWSGLGFLSCWKGVSEGCWREKGSCSVAAGLDLWPPVFRQKEISIYPTVAH